MERFLLVKSPSFVWGEGRYYRYTAYLSPSGSLSSLKESEGTKSDEHLWQGATKVPYFNLNEKRRHLSNTKCS